MGSRSEHKEIDGVVYRRCSKGDNCVNPTGQWLTDTEVNFTHKTNQCRKCIAEYLKSYRNEHKHELREYHLKYYAENPEVYHRNRRAFRARHREKLRENYKLWRAKNREKIRAYRKATIEKSREHHRAYRVSNPDAAKLSAGKRRARQLSLPDTLTKPDWVRSLEYFRGCCAYCGNQRDFWKPLHLDHFIPLSTPECTGTIPTNIVPACASCNLSKNAKEPLVWLKEHFGPRKGKQIYNRIQEYFAWVQEQQEQEMSVELINADFMQWLKDHQQHVEDQYIGDNFVPPYHAVLADPPYFLGSITKRFGKEGSAPAKHGADGSFGRLSKGFMGKQWDGFLSMSHYQEWITEWGTMLLDYVYPGGILAMYGGSRTYHRLACGLEDAGWEIFDCLIYLYGTGFPKAADTGRFAGEDFDGYKTAIKPAYEPIVLARAPRFDLTYGELATRYGTGSLNIDGARIGEEVLPETTAGQSRLGTFERNDMVTPERTGRYPANIMLGCTCGNEDTHSPDCPVYMLDQASGESVSSGGGMKDLSKSNLFQGTAAANRTARTGLGDRGGASRFFYTAKVSAFEREAGLDGFEAQIVNDGRETEIDNPYQRGDTLRKNIHPTLKPINLNTWLATLLLPPPRKEPRRLLIPFSGVASEVIGAMYAGWDEITGIEREAEYVRIAKARLEYWSSFPDYDAAAGYGKSKDRDQESAGQLSMFD